MNLTFQKESDESTCEQQMNKINKINRKKQRKLTGAVSSLAITEKKMRSRHFTIDVN